MAEKSGITKKLEQEIIIKGPIERIFNIVANHEDAPEWINEVKSISLIKEGKPRNGKGAIRRIIFKSILWTNVDEEITDFRKNVGYRYTIISSMPGLLKHKGEWSVIKLGKGKTKVVWTLLFKFKKLHWYRLLLNIFVYQVTKFQINALASLKEKVEKI